MASVIFRRDRYKWGSARECSPFHALTPFSVLERDYSHPECSEPRDRILAALGLADNFAEFDKLSNCNSSCTEIYTKATRKFLDQAYIDILSYCQFLAEREDSLLSSVPDWRLPGFNPNTYSPWSSTFSPSMHTLSQQVVSHRNCFLTALKEIFVDTVEEVGHEGSSDWLEALEAQETLRHLSGITELLVQSPRIKPANEES